jgi:hypothetical protein
VPGYYHRRQEDGEMCHSTCCNSESNAAASAVKSSCTDPAAACAVWQHIMQILFLFLATALLHLLSIMELLHDCCAPTLLLLLHTCRHRE